MLWRANLLVLFIACYVCFLAVIEVGFRLGRRHREESNDAAITHVGALQTALLGLLALLLGFTFAMAATRFEKRKALVVEEANAIGTTFLRSKFLLEPHRQVVAGLLRDYVAARIAAHNERSEGARRAADATGSRIQQELWAQTEGVGAQQPTSVPVGLFIHALNQAIDLREESRAALDNHVPETVLFLLILVTAVSLALVAYGSGLTGHRRFVLHALFALLLVLVLTIILDLDRPRRGLIKVSQVSMIRLKETIE
jgi:hypothetical protein